MWEANVRAPRPAPLLTAASAWFVFGHKPISESEIQREIRRQRR